MSKNYEDYLREITKRESEQAYKVLEKLEPHMTPEVLRKIGEKFMEIYGKGDLVKAVGEINETGTKIKIKAYLNDKLELEKEIETKDFPTAEKISIAVTKIFFDNFVWTLRLASTIREITEELLKDKVKLDVVDRKYFEKFAWAIFDISVDTKVQEFQKNAYAVLYATITFLGRPIIENYDLATDYVEYYDDKKEKIKYFEVYAKYRSNIGKDIIKTIQEHLEIMEKQIKEHEKKKKK